MWLFAVLAGAAQAEPRPAPAYFVEVTFATTTAQAVAVACPTLSFELLQASRASRTVMERLAQDGFDLDNLEQVMADPSQAFDALRLAFLDRHGLADGASAERVCAAGLREIAERTEIGRYLTEVPG